MFSTPTPPPNCPPPPPPQMNNQNMDNTGATQEADKPVGEEVSDVDLLFIVLFIE